MNSESLHMKELHLLPKYTFGRQFADYMAAHHFDINERPKVKHISAMENEELVYLMLRYRQIHDFWWEILPLLLLLLSLFLLRLFLFKL